MKQKDIDFEAIAFSTYYSSIYVELNDELIYKYGDKDEELSEERIGNLYAIVTLPEIDDGIDDVTFTIRFYGDKNVYPYGFEVGSVFNLTKYLVLEYISVLITLMCAVAGFLLLLFMRFSKRTRKYYRTEYVIFVFFFLFCGVWELLDSQYLMMLGLSAGAVCLASFELYILLSVPMILFVYLVSDCIKVGKIIDIVLVFLVFATFIALNIINFVFDYSFLDTLLFSHLAVFVPLVVMLIQIFVIWIKSLNRKNKKLYRERAFYAVVFLGLLVLAISAVIQVVLFNMNPTESNTKILRIGVLFIGVTVLFGIINRINVTDNAEKRILHDKLFDDRRKLEEFQAVMSDAFRTIVPDEYITEIIDVYRKKKEIIARGEEVDEDTMIIKVGHGRRHASILVSDIRGFSEISSKLNYNRLGEMLNYYLGSMTDIVERYNGHVLEFMGDGILAGFGITDEDSYHADNAIRAAIEMQKALPDINKWNERHGFPNHVEIGIGISTGDVFAGVIGSLDKFKYDVLGSNVNLASRIESYTIGGQILISQETKDECHENLGILANIKATPKGFDQEMTYYYISGIGDLKLDIKTDITHKLNHPIKVTFNVYQDKANNTKEYNGLVVEVGENSIVLSTKVNLSLFDIVKVNHKEGVTCKVISFKETGVTLRFTSMAQHFNGAQLFEDVASSDEDLDEFDNETRKLLKEKKNSYSFYK